jgi:hypothetical protein
MVNSTLGGDASPRIDAMVSNGFQRTNLFQRPSVSLPLPGLPLFRLSMIFSPTVYFMYAPQRVLLFPFQPHVYPPFS